MCPIYTPPALTEDSNPWIPSSRGPLKPAGGQSWTLQRHSSDMIFRTVPLQGTGGDFLLPHGPAWVSEVLGISGSSTEWVHPPQSTALAAHQQHKPTFTRAIDQPVLKAGLPNSYSSRNIVYGTFVTPISQHKGFVPAQVQVRTELISCSQPFFS